MTTKAKSNRWVLVTGAASGIGAELCLLFARGGYSLVLVDKNAAGLEQQNARLQQKFGIRTAVLIHDLSHQEAAQAIFDELEAQEIELEILVNNAGFGLYGPFWEVDLARDQALVNVNIMAPMLLTKLVLPGMVARRQGRILNVGSVSGFLASPYATTYYSSKAWLLSFSQGLSTALRGTGVSVTVVCPGPTYTAFDWHSSGDGDAPPDRKPFQMDASEVARQAYRGLGRRQMIVIPGASNVALALFAKLLPRQFALWMLTLGQKKAN